MLTKDELLKPRYKVIADYPAAQFKIGDIFTFQCTFDFEPVDGENEVWYDSKSGVFMSTVSKYPHLFKRLEWWEERKDTDPMPMYLKYKGSIVVAHVHFAGTPNIFWAFKNGEEGERMLLSYKDCQIATEEEYNQYIYSVNETSKQ